MVSVLNVQRSKLLSCTKTIDMSEVPVILCTGHSSTVTPEKAKAAGIRELIYKPISKKEIAGTIRKLFDQDLFCCFIKLYTRFMQKTFIYKMLATGKQFNSLIRHVICQG